MRFVVTGAAGFIGSHLVERLLAAGHDVAGIDCFTDYYGRALKEANLASARQSERFTFAELDLRSDRLDDVIDGADVVIHEAAMAGLLRSWSDVDAYNSCNFTGTARLVDAIARAGTTRLVHASTSSVYGRDATGDEGAALEPTSPYGVTKLAAEKLVLAHAQTNGLPAVVLRYFSIYGPRQRPDMGYFQFIEALLDGKEITVTGDGLQTRSNTFITDCVDATIAAATTPGVEGEIFNIGGGDVVSVLDVLAILEKITGSTPKVRHAAPRPGDQRHTRADFTKATATLGYEPRVGAVDGLTAQVEWQRSLRRA